MRGVIVNVLILSMLSCTADGFSGVAPFALRKGGLSFSSANGAPNVRAPWAAPGLRENVGSLRCASTNSFNSVEKALVEARNLGDFTSTLEKSRIVFVKLYQGKCRKCVALAPKFKSLAEQHASCGDVVFMKVAADKLREIAEHTGIKRAPTIQAYVDGVLFEQIDADQDTKEVSSRLKSLVTDVIGQYRGFGGTTGIGAPAAESAVEDADIASTVDGMDMGDCGPDGCEIVW